MNMKTAKLLRRANEEFTPSKDFNTELKEDKKAWGSTPWNERNKMRKQLLQALKVSKIMNG